MQTNLALTDTTLTPRDPGQQFHALILDDDDIDRMRLRRMCAKAGMSLEVAEAADLAEFRELLNAHTFDLVFIDHHLGMETGLEALKILVGHEEQSGAIPIMVTSVTDHNVAVEAMRNGCADYLVKEEASPSAIRKSVASAMERRILMAALSEARVFRSNMRRSVTRFSNTCGPEMRGILSGILRQSRTLRDSGRLDPDLAARLTVLERGSRDLVCFLDDLLTIVDGAREELGQAPAPRLLR